MKRIVPFLLSFFSVAVHGQIVSKFTWDTNPVTQAVVGPNAISVSSSATSSSNGVNGTNGLNPGTPTQNVNLTLTGSPYFDIPGIDITVSFRREESQASFFTRGSNFDFGMSSGNLYTNFILNKGSQPGTTAVNSGSVYSMPNDHAFHVYRFRYDNNTGMANMWVDNSIVYTYNGTAGHSLNWTNAGNVVIGTNMDATGSNVVVLDNMLIQNPAVTFSLPLKLLSFTAEAKTNTALLNWSTTQEVNTASFVIERAADGITFVPVKTVSAGGQYNGTNNYSSTDSAVLSPVSYYRLKMVDADGAFTYSDIRELSFGATKTTISCFPNPTTDYINLRIENSQAASYSYIVSTLDGKIVTAASIRANSGVQTTSINLASTTVKGVLIVQLLNNTTHTQQSFKIVKQ